LLGRDAERRREGEVPGRKRRRDAFFCREMSKWKFQKVGRLPQGWWGRKRPSVRWGKATKKKSSARKG